MGSSSSRPPWVTTATRKAFASSVVGFPLCPFAASGCRWRACTVWSSTTRAGWRVRWRTSWTGTLAAKFAFLAGPEKSVESNQRLAGARLALHERGLELDPRQIFYGNFTATAGRTGAKALLDRGRRVDAIVAANDDMGLGALTELIERGVRVPDEVKVCGFDDIHAADYARPALSSLRQPMWWLGSRAVDAILDQIEGRDVPLLQAGALEFVRRESCGCGQKVVASVRPPGAKEETESCFPSSSDRPRSRTSSKLLALRMNASAMSPRRRAIPPFLLGSSACCPLPTVQLQPLVVPSAATVPSGGAPPSGPTGRSSAPPPVAAEASSVDDEPPEPDCAPGKVPAPPTPCWPPEAEIPPVALAPPTATAPPTPVSPPLPDTLEVLPPVSAHSLLKRGIDDPSDTAQCVANTQGPAATSRSGPSRKQEVAGGDF